MDSNEASTSEVQDTGKERRLRKKKKNLKFSAVFEDVQPKKGKVFCFFCAVAESKITGLCRRHEKRTEILEAALSLPDSGNNSVSYDEKLNFCVICDVNLNPKSALRHYISDIHLERAKMMPSELFGKCPICKLMFTDVRDSKEHFTSFHHYYTSAFLTKAQKLVKKVVPQVPISESVKEKLEKIREDPNNVEFSLLCRQCEKSVRGSDDDCSNHITEHCEQKENPACYVCKKTFSSLSKLYAHETGTSHKCNVIRAKMAENEEEIKEILSENEMILVKSDSKKLKVNYNCTLCDTKHTPNDLLSHVVGRRHSENFKRLGKASTYERITGVERDVSVETIEEKFIDEVDRQRRWRRRSSRIGEEGEGDVKAKVENENGIEGKCHKAEDKKGNEAAAKEESVHDCLFCYLNPSDPGKNEKCQETHVLHESLLSLPDRECSGVTEEEKLKLCVVCDEFLEDYERAVDHYTSEDHLLKAGIEKEELTVRCALCKVDFDIAINRETHYTSMKHFSNVIFSTKVKKLCSKIITDLRISESEKEKLQALRDGNVSSKENDETMESEVDVLQGNEEPKNKKSKLE